jgi:hypothetical protein
MLWLVPEAAPPGREPRLLRSLLLPPPTMAGDSVRAPELWWADSEANAENLVRSPPSPLAFLVIESLQQSHQH